MYFRTVNPVWEDASIRQALNQLVELGTVEPIFPTLDVMLFKSAPAPPLTPFSIATDFLAVEADFTGYARQPITIPWVGSFNPNPDQLAKVASVMFPTGSPLLMPNNIVGYALIGPHVGPTRWLMAEMFPQPFPLAEFADYLSLDIIVPVLYRPIVES